MGDQQPNPNSERLQDLLETSPLETAAEINTIIKLFKHDDINLNLISFFSEQDVNTGVYPLYDELVDRIFERQIDEPTRTKLGGLLEKILEHDPMLIHEQKKRASKEDQVYGFSESISDNYLKMNGPDANIPITTLYEQLVSHGYIPLKFKKFDDGKPDGKYRLRDHQLKIKAGLVKFAPEPEEEIVIEDAQIQKLETMYTNMCQNREKNADEETQTHDLNPDADIIVFIIYGKHYCYQKRHIFKNLHDGNLFHKWIKKDDSPDWSGEPHNVEYFNIVNFDSGYGGMGGKTTYIQLMVGPTTKMLFDVTGIIALLEHNFLPFSQADYGETFTNVFNVTVSIKKERVGEHNTNFGASQTHGQNDHVAIHTLTPVFESDDEHIQQFITYQRENMTELITKLKDETDGTLDQVSVYDTTIITDARDYYRSCILSDEETAIENAQSYEILFTDEEFLKTVPKNEPSFHRSDLVDINMHNSVITNLFGIIRRIYREPEIPDDRIVKWTYDITPFYEPYTYYHMFTITDDSHMTRINDFQEQPYDPEQALRNGDDISGTEDDDRSHAEDFGEILRDVNDWDGEDRRGNDSSTFVPGSPEYGPNDIEGDLFGPDSDDEGSPDVSFEIDRRGNRSPMRLEELMDSPNSSPIRRSRSPSTFAPASPEYNPGSPEYNPYSPPGLSRLDSPIYVPNSPSGPVPPSMPASFTPPPRQRGRRRERDMLQYPIIRAQSPDGPPPPLQLPPLQLPIQIPEPEPEEPDSESELGFGGKKRKRNKKTKCKRNKKKNKQTRGKK